MKLIIFIFIIVLFFVSACYVGHELLFSDKVISSMVEASMTKFYGEKVECNLEEVNKLCINYPYINGMTIEKEQLIRLGCVFYYGDHVKSKTVNNFCENI